MAKSGHAFSMCPEHKHSKSMKCGGPLQSSQETLSAEQSTARSPWLFWRSFACNHTYTSLTIYTSYTWNTGRYCSFFFFLLLYSMIYIHEHCPCFWYLNMHLPIILTTDKEKRKCTQESSLSSQRQKKEYHKYHWDMQYFILFKICFQRTETSWPVITWPRLKFLAVPSRKYYSYFYYADFLPIDLCS